MLRYATAIVLGALVTIAVLFTMQRLIVAPKGKLDETGSRHFVDFVRVERDESIERTERRREKPLPPETPPPAVPQPRVTDMSPTEMSVSVPAAPVGLEMSIAGPGLVASDGDYLPIVKIAPQYPMSARTRGIEGYCVVEYTVTRAGTVRDAFVVDADPRGLFDKASVEAALRFKYRPRVVNGEPIEVRGVRNLFRYELED